MKRNLFKALLTIAIVAVLFSALAVTASAADVTESTSGTCGADGDNLTWILYSNGELVISGTGVMKDYSDSSSTPWYSYKTAITSITIENGATTIGNYAFHDCTNLTNIDIPEGVTTIGNYAFYRCTNLASIDIPEGVTTIGERAFFDCTNLTSIDIPFSVKNIGNAAFSYCSKLASATIHSGMAEFGTYVFGNTASDIVIYGGANSTAQIYANANDHSFEVIEIPRVEVLTGECGADGDNLTWVLYSNGEFVISGTGAMKNYSGYSSVPWHSYRTAITSITIENGATTICKYAFYFCTNLTSIDIPESVTSIGNSAFRYCTNLTSIDIPESVTSIGNYAFEDCTNLASIDIPESVTSIGDNAFQNCTNLTSIDIPFNVKKIGTLAFYGCSKLNSVTIYSRMAEFGGNVFGNTASDLVIYCGANSTAQRYATANDHSFEVIEIPRVEVFTGTCGAEGDNLTWVLYSNGDLVISGTGAMKDYGDFSSIPWYSYRTAITSITIENGVTTIGNYAFCYCSNLTSIDIPEGVTTIGNDAFYRCSNLTSIDIPESVTTIGEYAFYGCTVLTSVELPKNVQSVGSYAFRYCEALTTVRVMGENTLFDTEVFYGTASKFEIHGYSGSIAEIYALDNGHKFVPILNLKFAGVSITLQNNIALSYRVDKEAFDALGYTDPYVVFEFDGSTKTVSNYTEKDGRYVFTFSNIIPGMIGENVKGTLYATYDGNTYASTAQNFSIAKYCYAMLDAAKGDEYAKLRTLLVDLLNYGAMAQIYTDHDTENLVNAALTEEQRAYGTQTAPELVSHLNTKHKTIDAPIAKWKAVSLILNDSVTVKLRISAENIEGLSLKAVVNDRTTLIPASSFVAAGENEYFIYFKGLVAKEFSDCIYFTVMDGETEVSNTLQYSVETYAYTSQTGSSTEALKNLTNAMMNYGKAAYVYEN